MSTYTPSILHRLSAAWRFFRHGLKAAPYAWPAWRENRPDWQITDLQSYVNEGFNANSLIYSALLYKYRSSLLAPLRAYGGDPLHPEVLPPRHPLSKLLLRPNDYQSGLEFQGLCEIYLNLAGNVYVYLDRPRPGAPPSALRLLRPDRVFVVPAKGGLSGYLYVPEGRFPRIDDVRAEDVVPIAPEDMMHVKLPNPGDPLEGIGQGLSPVSSLARNADVDNSVTNFLKRFFDAGTMLAGVVSFDAALDDATINRIQERWREKYGGWEHMASEVAVFGGGGKYQSLTQNFNEMGFDAIDERSETRILGPFGVPLILLNTRAGLGASTLANYEQSDKHFWNNVMVPERQLFEAEYQHFLSLDNAYPAFDLTKIPSMQKDIPKLAEAAVKLWSMGMPAGQALATVGIDAEEWEGSDESYVPSSVTPAKQALAPPPAPAPALPAPAPTEEGESEPGAAGSPPEDEGLPEAEPGEESRKGIVRPFRRLRLAPDGRTPGDDLDEDGHNGDGARAGLCDCGCGDVRGGQTGSPGDAV